jgi:hypothetical protein
MMLYIKLSCDALTDEKLLAVGPEAVGVWVRGLLWSKQHLRDGVVTRDVTQLVTLGSRDPVAIIADLVRVGLWSEHPDGYTVGRDKWARYQTTAEDVSRSQEQARLRKQKQRERNKKSHTGITQMSRVTPSDVTQGCHAPVTAQSEYRVQSTETKKEPPIAPLTKSNGEDPLAGFDQFWLVYPKKVGKPAAQNKWRTKGCAQIKSDILAAVEAQKQLEQWRKDAGQFIPNPTTWLNQERWTDETAVVDQPDPWGGYDHFAFCQRCQTNHRTFPNPEKCPLEVVHA